jgi:hypothetical protein
MAFETVGLPVSWPAAGNLSGFQYYAVTSTTAGLITTGGTTAVRAIGVLQDDPNALNAMGSVMQQGISRCVCYGGDTAINPGDALGFGTSGFAVKTTTDNGEKIGFAQEYLGDTTPAIIAILVEPGRY